MPFVIPLEGFVTVMMQAPKVETTGKRFVLHLVPKVEMTSKKFVLHFGAQSFVNIYLHGLGHSRLCDRGDGDSFMMWNPSSALFPDAGKSFVIPLEGFVSGIDMMQVPKVATSGKLVLCFGAQSFMHIYMGRVMRTSATVAQGTQLPKQWT